MQRVKSDRSWRWIGALCLAVIALGSTNVFALPRSRPAEPGDGPVDPGDVPDEPAPRPRPDRPPPKPPVPGYVLFNGAYYRETRLPLCEWGQSERNFWDQFIRQDADQTWQWTCLDGSTRARDPETGNYLNDTCSFAGPPANRPTDAAYGLVPRDYWENYTSNLEWPDGTAAYGGWGMRCERNSSNAAVDTVVSSTFEGMSWNGSSCPQWPNAGNRSTLIAELVGGDVEHVRPAVVRALANIGYPAYAGPRNISGDLVVAIQVFGSSGWEDFKTIARTTGPQPSLYELEATVPEGSFVRVQVRGTQKCHGVQYGDGYDIRSLRIQVETCIPDENNPGTCL